MRRKTFGSFQKRIARKKKTRQGMSNNTKFGNKNSKKYYKKRSKGQG